MDMQAMIKQAQEIAAAMPEPKVDAFHIHSFQEREALREHMDTVERRASHLATPMFDIPLHIVDDTPPGVLRAMLKGEVVEDVPIR